MGQLHGRAGRDPRPAGRGAARGQAAPPARPTGHLPRRIHRYTSSTTTTTTTSSSFFFDLLQFLPCLSVLSSFYLFRRRLKLYQILQFYFINDLVFALTSYYSGYIPGTLYLHFPFSYYLDVNCVCLNFPFSLMILSETIFSFLGACIYLR